MPSDTSAVRTSEELPVGILTEYLRGKIEGEADWDSDKIASAIKPVLPPN